MSNGDKETGYYIRIRGRVLGPYSVKQLNTLRVRGQFSQSNEISTNGQSWEPAASLEELFGAPAKKAGSKELESAATAPTAKSAGDAAPWHYSVNGEQHGPATTSEIQEMLDFGQLNLRDLVWKEGMSEWTPLSEVPTFSRLKNAKSATRSKANESRAGRSVSEGEATHHFLDHVVAGLRSLTKQWYSNTTGNGEIEVGRYAMYISIFLHLILGFIFAVKTNVLEIGLIGVSYAIAAFALQYSAVKSCHAIRQRIQIIQLRMYSAALFDSIAVILLLGGIAALTVTAIISIRSGSIPLMIAGLAILLACVQLGFRCLHPESMGITFSKQTRIGDECLAVWSLLVTLPLRFVASTFATFAALSVVGTCIALLLLLPNFQISPLGYEVPIIVAECSAGLALLAAAYPILMYVHFLLAYLWIELARAILEILDIRVQVAQIAIRHQEKNEGGDGSKYEELAANSA